jgi:hypothetical protein
VHENQGRVIGPTEVPDGGELRKTNSHSPLEILHALYTAKTAKGQHNFAVKQGISNYFRIFLTTRVPSNSFFSTFVSF